MAEHLTTDELIQKHLDRTASAAELAELERRLGDPTALEAFVAAGRMDAWLSTLLKEEAPIMPEDILKQTPKARRRSACDAPRSCVSNHHSIAQRRGPHP